MNKLKLKITLIKAYLYDLYLRFKYRKMRMRNQLSSGKFRNLRCPCGSGKKVKDCHGIKRDISFGEYLEIDRMIDLQTLNVSTSIKHIEAI